MGKLQFDSNSCHSPTCKDKDAAICGNESCKLSNNYLDEKTLMRSVVDSQEAKISFQYEVDEKIIVDEKQNDETVKELVIIGSGPHALTLMLRLLEPDPDFLTEKKRHLVAESTKQMRPIRELHRHVKDILRGSKPALLKPKRKNSKQKKKKKKKKVTDVPPPLPLKTVIDAVQVVDANGDWLASWKQNFNGIGIPQLRSLMSAHADPFDHRSMECFAELAGRGDELVTLKALRQRDKTFTGPYQVPSTSVFHDFHDKLIKAYGINDVVQQGKVLSITAVKDNASDENIFEVKILDDDEGVTTVRSRRCVCALGPNFNRAENIWERELRREQGQNYANLSKKILRCDEIVQFLLHKNVENQKVAQENPKRLLIIGGGITSVQLAIRAINSSWCESVHFIQRSQQLIRHFDVENAWMGPKRGRILDEFFSMEMEDRVGVLKDARKGGSVPPELSERLQDLEEKRSNLVCKEEVQISQVEWINEEFYVTLDDGSTTTVDNIWLATGCNNALDTYPVLDNVRKSLPIDVINGLPVLSKDLSWASDEFPEECRWKQLARKRIWCMGAMAGLQLGADALNIVGARHGAVKIAKAIRCDMNECTAT